MTSTNQLSQEFTLRLLNGMLSGVEFSLATARTLFCVGETPAYDAGSPAGDVQAQVENTLYIPAETSGPNFAILLDLDRQQGDFSVEVFEQPARIEALRYQTPCQIGNLVFALKPNAEGWSDAVLQYNASQPINRPVKTAKPHSRLLLKSLLSLLLLGILATGSSVAWRYLDKSASAREKISLDAMLQAPNHHFMIRQGRDQVFYVLAENEMDAAWAQQQLARSGFDRPTRVLSIPAEQTRLYRWLDEHQVQYFLVRLKSLNAPVLVLSQQRNARDAASLHALQQGLLATMPYAQTVDLVWQSDLLVAAEAKARLDKLALSYTCEGDAAHSLVYVLKGEVDDGTLSQLRQQIAEFEHGYGERYVRFVLEQREDWLKGKSYKYGANGYVQLSPRHWYFPKPL